MKKVIILIYVFLFLCFSINAQTVSSDISLKIAQKMKGSLLLTDAQFNSIFNINVALANNKKSTRSQYSTMDSIISKMQKIENSRDSLYKTILTQYQFDVYFKNKQRIVNNN